MKIARQELAKPLERAVADGHPWVYRDALARKGGAGSVEPGTVVDLHDRRGRFLARGVADSGPIALRLWSMRRVELDRGFFLGRIASALALRERLAVPETTALRWVHGEGDRMPGFVCDRYGSVLVVAWDGEGIGSHAPTILAALTELALARGVTSILVKRGRGQEKQLCVHHGELPAGELEVSERGMRMLVDLGLGQKTGMFLDHRDSRLAVRGLARGGRVLNLYGYTGGFSIAAGLGGALEVTTVDQSAPAIEMAQRAWALNGLDPALHRGVATDVRSFLEDDSNAAARDLDLVISDPPSFAPNQRSLDKALDAYRKLHRSAVQAVADGGLYLAASCSAHVHRTAFESSLRDGARDARRHIQVLGRWGAGADHPVALGFAEGDYLTVTLCRVHAR